MLLPVFEFHEPESIQETCQILSEYGLKAKLIAGGTDLMVNMKKQILSPEQVISISRIPDLKHLDVSSGRILVGSGVTVADLCESKTVAQYLPALGQGAQNLGTPLIRNLATIGGNIGSARPAADLPPSLMAYGADIVLESREWIEASKGLRDWLVKYREILERIVSGDLGKSEVVHGGCVREIRDGSFGFLYVKNNRCVLLLEPFKGAHAPEGKLEYYRKIFGDDAPGKERLERFAKRAYPAFAALDDEIWLEIQKDDEANLSLSPEEAELLDAIRSGARDTAFYPLFINGRAGSGKSTMLQYLMADYMGQTLACKSPLMPLYMTCGDALLSHARRG